MKVLDFKAQAVFVDPCEGVLAIARGDKASRLIRIRYPKLSIEELHSFNGERCLLLAKIQDLYLASIDNALFVSRDLIEWRRVLEVSASNIIWHMCETSQGVIVQEYGDSPTSLWFSDNGYRWNRFLTNLDIDSTSRHFHSIAYDGYRDVVYATLGDANPIRAVAIHNHDWKPLHVGPLPWQLLPIVVLKDRVVFGFDSGIARGGIGIFYPEEERWSFIFLRWIDKHVRYCLMCDFTWLGNGIWISALAIPQAIIVSENLRQWYSLYVEGYERRFKHHMNVRVHGDLVACSTGRRLLFFSRDEVEKNIGGKPVMTPYRGFIDRVRGTLFTIKRMGMVYGKT